MSTHAYIDTKAYSVAFLADKLMYSVKEIIRGSGLDPVKLSQQWNTLEHGISRWLHTQDLMRVSVEIFHPRRNRLIGRWDMEIIYGYGGDGTMHADMNPIREMIEREGQAPAECDYRIMVVAKPTADEVHGWGDLNEYDIGQHKPRRLGYLLWAGDTAVDYSYWKKG